MECLCLNRGAVLVKNGMPAYKHYCAVIKGKRILSEAINEYSGTEGTCHAEEAALLKSCLSRRNSTNPGWYEKGPCLQGV
jgi:pyrimidine deaminase RibD-like protein